MKMKRQDNGAESAYKRRGAERGGAPQSGRIPAGNTPEAFPSITKKYGFGFALRRTIFATFSVGFLVCLIVNICVGGKPWCLYPLGAEFLFWLAFVAQAPIEARFMYRVFGVMLTLSLYLTLIDVLDGKLSWSLSLVVPILGFSGMIFMGSYILVFRKKQACSLTLVFFFILCSLVAILLGIVGVYSVSWPLIVLGSCALAVLIFTVALYRSEIIRELKKRFHTR